MKKVCSLLLVVIMLFAMSTTALADGATTTTGSITITNAEVGETYTIYQLLTLAEGDYDFTNGGYRYKASPTWKEWLKTQNDYVEFDGDYVTWVEVAGELQAAKDARAVAFAKAAQKYATENSIEHNGSKTATSTTVKFECLGLGYYLVDTTLGSLCNLTTTNPEVKIQEKNEEPSIEKEVQEDSTGDWGARNDADIGDTVYFKTTVTAKPGAENYVVHDKMSEGLTFKNDIQIKVGETVVSADKYLMETTSLSYGCTFKITFTQAYLDSLTEETEIVITYSATLNKNAVVGLSGNPNDTWLEWSNNPTHTTEKSQTTTYTWDMDVLKYGNGDESKVLSGAEFVLLNKEKTKVATFANDGKLTGWQAIPTDGTWPTASVLTTGTDGKIHVAGLDSDTYYLRETKAPAGFNKLDDDVEVKITGATVGEGATLSYTTVVAKINNQGGSKLPETGSTGTVIFVATGSILALVAVVFLITRKKMSVYEN